MKFISKLSGSERTFFFIFTVVIVLFLLDRFAFEAIRTQIEDTDSQISGMRTDLVEFNRVLQNKDKIEKEFELYGPYMRQEESPELKLQQTLNTLAIQAEMAVTELKPVPTREKGRIVTELVTDGKNKQPGRVSVSPEYGGIDN